MGLSFCFNIEGRSEASAQTHFQKIAIGAVLDARQNGVNDAGMGSKNTQRLIGITMQTAIHKPKLHLPAILAFASGKVAPPTVFEIGGSSDIDDAISIGQERFDRELEFNLLTLIAMRCVQPDRAAGLDPGRRK
jgi:hypothetical protein